MKIKEAKQLYIGAGCKDDHSPDTWKLIRKEMERIVSASSDRAAAEVVQWWGCWDKGWTAIAFARRVRKAANPNPTETDAERSRRQIKGIKAFIMKHPLDASETEILAALTGISK
jgi:hypothetical protein